MYYYNNKNVTSFLFHEKINWKPHTSTFFAAHHKTLLFFNTRIIVIRWGNGWTLLLPERVLLAIGVWAAVEYDTSLGSSGESFSEVRSPAVIYTVSFFFPLRCNFGWNSWRSRWSSLGGATKKIGLSEYSMVGLRWTPFRRYVCSLERTS